MLKSYDKIVININRFDEIFQSVANCCKIEENSLKCIYI